MHFLINIDVHDLKKAVPFYTKALGLRPGRVLEDSMMELVGGPTPIYLLENKTGTRVSRTSDQTRTYSRHWTPIHLDIVVDDIHAAVQRAADAGAVLEEDILTYAYGHLALMADPFGHGFCFIQFTGRGYDEIVLENWE